MRFISFLIACLFLQNYQFLPVPSQSAVAMEDKSKKRKSPPASVEQEADGSGKQSDLTSHPTSDPSQPPPLKKGKGSHEEEEEEEEEEEGNRQNTALSLEASETDDNGELEVTIYNIGQGNCILLRYPHIRPDKKDEFVLVDCGSSEHASAHREEMGDVPTINIKEIIKSIQYTVQDNPVTVLVSHLDRDHTDLIPDIFPKPSTNMKVVIPGEGGGKNEMTKKFEEWTTNVDPDKFIVIKGKDLIRLKAELSHLPLIPLDINEGIATQEAPTIPNPNSLILQAKPHLESLCSITLTGDATELTTHAVAKSGKDISTTVMLACHHGATREGCNNEEWIGKTQPQSVIFSAGYRAGYYHPQCSIIERYQKISQRLEKTASHPLECFNEDQAEKKELNKALFSTFSQGTLQISFKNNHYAIGTDTDGVLAQGECLKNGPASSDVSDEQK